MMRKISKACVLSVFWGFGLGCASPQTQSATNFSAMQGCIGASCAKSIVAKDGTSQWVPPEGVLGRGDLLDVTIFGEKGLSGAYRLDPEGVIQLPLVGALPVLGLSLSQAVARLEEAYRLYLREPSVVVQLKEVRSRRVYVLGQVRKPGTFVFEEGMNVIQAITMAGGLDRMANADSIVVTRIAKGGKERRRIDVDAIEQGDEENIALASGDIVYVPEVLF